MEVESPSMTRLPPVTSDENGPDDAQSSSAGETITVRLVSHQAALPPHVPETTAGPTDAPSDARSVEWTSGDQEVMPPEELSPPEGNLNAVKETVYPIDLANALGLGGASHLQIRIARERILEAQAEFMRAKTTWLPSLRVGIGWNKHDGRLQEIRGQVLEISRNSLFVGGGAGLGTASLAGGAGGPSRLVVNLSLADALFEPHVAAHLVASTQAASSRSFNDSLAEIAFAYFDLLEAYGTLANAQLVEDAAEKLMKMTADFAREGAGSDADAARAKAAYSNQKQLTAEAERRSQAASVELARLVRLDPAIKLAPVEDKIAMVELVDSTYSTADLVSQGLSFRPELAEHQSLINAALSRNCQERWRPWLPNVQVGASAGTFGGGPQTVFQAQAGRSDVDLLAVWELQNGGYGNRAARNQTASQFRRARLQLLQVQDRIAAEIITAANDVAAYRLQVEAAMKGAEAAEQSYRLDLQRVELFEGLPLELLQSITALQQALDDYTTSTAQYNQSQVELLRAIGQIPSAPAEQQPPPVPDDPGESMDEPSAPLPPPVPEEVRSQI